MEYDKIYGVDPNKKVTAIMVRDAIIECFFIAHKEILDKKDKYYSMKSKEELHAMKHREIVDLIESTMEDDGDEFHKPSKQSLIRLVQSLSKIAAKYRVEEIIKKHAGEIMVLINKL